MCNQQPHPHKDLIIAWANGATIQVKTSDGTWEQLNKPSWHLHLNYRIKPEEKKKVKRWLWMYKMFLADYNQTTTCYYTEEELQKRFKNSVYSYKKLPWSEMEFEE